MRVYELEPDAASYCCSMSKRRGVENAYSENFAMLLKLDALFLICSISDKKCIVHDIKQPISTIQLTKFQLGNQAEGINLCKLGLHGSRSENFDLGFR